MQLKRHVVEIERVEDQLRFFIQSLSADRKPARKKQCAAPKPKHDKSTVCACLVCVCLFALLIGQVYVAPILHWLRSG